jgi:hypothetical protein
VRRLLALLLFATPLFAQGTVPIIVQPAEWASPLNTVTGTRSNAPLTFGLGIPDAAAIP